MEPQGLPPGPPAPPVKVTPAVSGSSRGSWISVFRFRRAWSRNTFRAMVYSQARRSLPSRNCPAERDGPEKGLLGQFLRYSAVPAQAQGGTAEAPGSIPHRCVQSPTGSLPSVCITAKGRICYKIRPFLFAEGSRPSGPPRKQLFYTSLREGGLSILLIRPHRRTPPRLPLGEAWGSVYSAGAHIMRPTPCTEKSRPAAGPAPIAISYFRHRFKVGSQARRSLSASLLGAEGMSVLLIEFQVKGDHVLHCGLRRGECAPLIAPAAVIPVGASVGVAPHVLRGIQGHAAALAKDPLFHIKFLLLFGRGAPLLCAPQDTPGYLTRNVQFYTGPRSFSQSGPGPPAKRQGRAPPPGLRKREESPAATRPEESHTPPAGSRPLPPGSGPEQNSPAPARPRRGAKRRVRVPFCRCSGEGTSSCSGGEGAALHQQIEQLKQAAVFHPAPSHHRYAAQDLPDGAGDHQVGVGVVGVGDLLMSTRRCPR